MRPKAVIFDLGGVLISSPLGAIAEYESENNIPAGYINYAMSFAFNLANRRSTAQPNAWAELETGVLRTNETFYKRWSEDLSSSKAWQTFHKTRGIPVTALAPNIDGQVLLRRMIIPEKGGYLIPETSTALKKLKQNGVITCGLTNNFVCSPQVADLDYRRDVTFSRTRKVDGRITPLL